MNRKQLSYCLVFFLTTASLRAQNVKVFANSSQAAPHPTVVVEVPPGWSIVGGGATTSWNGSDPGNLLVSSYPQDERHWIATSKDHSVSSPAVLTAYAVAIENPNGSKYEVKTFTQTSASSDTPAVSVTVDGGYQMTGGGAQVQTDGV